MKTLLSLFLLLALGASAATGIKISEYPNTPVLTNSELFIVAVTNTTPATNRNITYGQLRSLLSSNNFVGSFTGDGRNVSNVVASYAGTATNAQYYIFAILGDSIHAQTNNGLGLTNWPNQMGNLSDQWNHAFCITNLAVPGTSTPYEQVVYATYVHGISPTNGQRGILTEGSAINDLYSTNSAIDIFLRKSNIWWTARNDGWKVLTFTPTIYAGAPNPVDWTNLVNLIVANAGMYDYLVRSDIILPDSAGSDYQSDHMHPSPSGSLKLSKAVAAALNAGSAVQLSSDSTLRLLPNGGMVVANFATNVGIGFSSNALAPLQIADATSVSGGGNVGILNPAILIGNYQDQSTESLQFGDFQSSMARWQHYLKFNAYAGFIWQSSQPSPWTEWMRLDGLTGYLGIRTNSPQAPLHVSGQSYFQAPGDSWTTAPIYGKATDSKTIWIGYNTNFSHGSIGAITIGSSHDNLDLCPEGGNVGITSHYATEKLTVGGNILCAGNLTLSSAGSVTASNIYAEGAIIATNAFVMPPVATGPDWCTNGLAAMWNSNNNGQATIYLRTSAVGATTFADKLVAP